MNDDLIRELTDYADSLDDHVIADQDVRIEMHGVLQRATQALREAAREIDPIEVARVAAKLGINADDVDLLQDEIRLRGWSIVSRTKEEDND